MVSPKRISNPNIPATAGTAVPVCRLMTAARRGILRQRGRLSWLDAAEMDMVPRELPGGRASFIHVFEPVETGRPAVQMCFTA